MVVSTGTTSKYPLAMQMCTAWLHFYRVFTHTAHIAKWPHSTFKLVVEQTKHNCRQQQQQQQRQLSDKPKTRWVTIYDMLPLHTHTHTRRCAFVMCVCVYNNSLSANQTCPQPSIILTLAAVLPLSASLLPSCWSASLSVCLSVHSNVVRSLHATIKNAVQQLANQLKTLARPEN